MAPSKRKINIIVKKCIPFEASVVIECMRASHRILTSLKYSPWAKIGGISPLPPRALATFAGTDIIFRIQSSQEIDCLAGAFCCENRATCSRSMGYSFDKRASRRMEYSVRGRDSILEYASSVTSPAATEVNKKVSGQKYCSTNKVSSSSESVVSQVGTTCSSKVRWRAGICLEIFKAPSGRGSVLYRLNRGGSKPMHSSGPQSSERRMVRSATGDRSRLITSLTRLSEWSVGWVLMGETKLEVLRAPQHQLILEH